jgi:hypothetical protein
MPVSRRNVIKVHAAGGGKSAIGVDDAAKAAISDIAERHGMKEIAVVSRIYLWASRQTDDVLVKGMLGLLPAGYEDDVVGLALERLRAKRGKGAAERGG